MKYISLTLLILVFILGCEDDKPRKFTIGLETQKVDGKVVRVCVQLPSTMIDNRRDLLSLKEELSSLVKDLDYIAEQMEVIEKPTVEPLRDYRDENL